jgi:uncharacterized Tic20 family protein
MDENMENQTPLPENPTEQSEGQTPPQPEPAPEPQTAGQQPNPTGMDIPKDERMWGMFCHLAALAGFTGIPFANVIGPLVVWLIKKEDYAFVRSQGTEALNFQISIAIYAIICFALFCIGIGPFLLAAVMLFDLIMIVIASVESNKGTDYRYPLSIRLIK